VQVGDELGRYKIAEELGAGGMATVFRARDRELRRDVAVKVLFPHLCKNREVMARFQREARAAASLDHKHILRVFDVGGGSPSESGDETDPPYIVLELVRGPSLDRVTTDGPLLAEIVASFGVVLCGALAHAHRAGVVHRDVKPGNVLVAEAGRLVLGDFGVARVADDDSSVVTRTGALLGTPAFMSPEQATGGELDERSDLYSLGATLYQLATGSLPVSGGAARAVAQIAQGQVIPPLRRNPRIGVDLARVIEKLMRVEADQRFAGAAEVETALRELVARTGREPDEIIRDFFADPSGSQARLLPVVLAASLSEARACAASQPVRALALADRALALDPGCRDALALVEDIGRGKARRRATIAALAVAAAGAATWAAFAIAPGRASRADFAAGSAADAGPAGTGAEAEAGRGGAASSPGTSPTSSPDSTVASSPGASPASPADSTVASSPGVESPASSPGESPASSPGASPTSSPGALPASSPGASPTSSPGASPTSSPGAETRSRAASAGRRRTGQRSPGSPPTGARASGAQASSAPAPGDRSSASDAGAAPPAVPEPAPAPADAVVTLEMDAWCNVTVAGKPLGQANPRIELRLAPGNHSIVCAQDTPGRSWSQRISLAPGQRITLRGRVLPPAVSVSVALSLGDAIRIDRSRVIRDGARIQLPAGRHRIELLKDGQTIALGFADLRGPPCTLKDEPQIACH
jgi:hypothetical protein